ncbi:DNA topoisomerase [Burkholderia gladioli]|uniref:DNA topoisomerase n=1 Tax=Burkholderia gladioli TaxID=28095 RepID=UPI00163E2F66|nr:DNA topoisomerase [Burkholderia gladioli]
MACIHRARAEPIGNLLADFHGIDGYPRTDCPWLATAQLADAPAVLAAIGRTVPELSGFAQHADPALVSRAWNDSKLGEHHGLIPTGTAPDLASLSPIEQAVYRAVSERYLAQFMPLCEADKAVIEVEAAGHRFVARGRVVRVPGWRVLFGASETPADTPTLPQLQEGQAIGVNDAKADQGRTSPPARFTQGTLLDAMRHVHRLVNDPDEKKKLRALDGIGRSATRAAIIETLLKRGLIVQNGKTITASPLGQILVDALPPTLTDRSDPAHHERLLRGPGGRGLAGDPRHRSGRYGVVAVRLQPAGLRRPGLHGRRHDGERAQTGDQPAPRERLRRVGQPGDRQGSRLRRDGRPRLRLDDLRPDALRSQEPKEGTAPTRESQSPKEKPAELESIAQVTERPVTERKTTLAEDLAAFQASLEARRGM